MRLRTRLSDLLNLSQAARESEVAELNLLTNGFDKRKFGKVALFFFGPVALKELEFEFGRIYDRFSEYLSIMRILFFCTT